MKNIATGHPGVIKKYVLYFDINKTLVLQDKAGGLSKEDSLLTILASYAWGRLDEKNPTMWKLVHNVFAKSCPGEGMMNYRQFVESIYPYKTPEEEPDAASRQAYNKEMKNNQRNLYLNFIKQGNPGIKLKPEFDKLMKYMNLPRAVIEELKLPKDGELKKPQYLVGNPDDEKTGDVKNNTVMERYLLQELFLDGKYNIVPNFFKFMMAMKKVKKEFAIIFRSFGNDIKDVIFEFNKFCAGDHPCYNGRNNFPLARFDGSKGSKNYIIDESHQGVYYRYSPSPQDVALCLGTMKRVPSTAVLEDEFAKELEDEAVKIVRELPNIHIKVQDGLKDSCGYAFQDDHEFWHANDEKMDFSKILTVDPTDYSTLPIFFDDNITDNEDNIVDVNDILNGMKLPLKKTYNKYLAKVDIIEVIKDPDYFFKIIDVCERARVEEIERIEKGLPEEMIEEIKKSEWEILQELPDPEYLRRTIMPLLHSGLKLVDIERPNDPLSFLAIHILKNKDKVKIPQPPQENADKNDQLDDGPEGKEEALAANPEK